MTGSRLPELSSLLDPASLRIRLDPIADARGSLTGVQPFYMRWKPGTSALLGLRLSWQTADGIVETLASLYLGDGLADAAEKAGTLRLVEPAMGPALHRMDDALFLAFPNDRLLKGLSAAADERRVCNRLCAEDTEFTARGQRFRKRTSHVHPVRWKPGRRAVLELDLELIDKPAGTETPWRAFARVMPASELEPRLMRWQAAARVRAVQAPAIVFIDRERSWFATAAIAGRALAATPTPAQIAAMRAAFIELHSQADPTLTPRSDGDDLSAAERALEGLARVAPELEPRSEWVRSRLVAGRLALNPATAVFTHGDLGTDQLLVDGDRLGVIDWDEAANGDPHMDWASLAADLRGRGLEVAWAESLAREVLGERFDGARMSWQRAAAEARRVLEGLQRGRADWRTRALDALGAAETLLAGVSTTPVTMIAPAARWLIALADPATRASVPGIDAAASRVAAVWPDGDDGAIVRIEGTPGTLVRWLRLGATVEVFDFPQDPALPMLAGLLASGRFKAAGHRLGKRAALRELDGGRFLFLRPAGAVEKAWKRVSEAYRVLSAAGVKASRPLALADDAPGWWAEAMPGRTLAATSENAETWRTFGSTLQRAHAAVGAPLQRAAAGQLAAAVRNGRKQVALVEQAEPAFAAELERDLAAVAAVALPAGRAAWIHGDLHPLQVLVGAELVILDWERARAGEAEEDLGNLLAHLAWEAFGAAPKAWSEFMQGYAQAGGTWDGALVAAHARAALARVRAVHGWRDGSRAAARDSTRWQAWQAGLAC